MVSIICRPHCKNHVQLFCFMHFQNETWHFFLATELHWIKALFLHLLCKYIRRIMSKSFWKMKIIAAILPCQMTIICNYFLELAFMPALIFVQRVFCTQYKKVKVVSSFFNSVEPIIFVVTMFFMFIQTDFWSLTSKKAFDWPVLSDTTKSGQF